MARTPLMGMGISRFAMAALAALTLSACNSHKPATVTIVPSERFQTMDAWEATAKMWEFDKRGNRFDGSWMPARDKILSTMIAEGGINRLRLELRSGAENPVDYWSQFRAGKLSYIDFKAHFYEKINDNADPKALNPKGIQFSELDFRVENFILPAMRIAKQLGRPMHFTLCYVDFGWTMKKGSLSHAAKPEEYAELIAAAYAHLKRKYGLEPEALEIILEPDNADNWDGKKIGTAIVAVSKRLEEQGVKPRIIAPSTSVARKMPRYFDDLATVPGAAEKISAVSYHRYGKLPVPEVADAIRARARRIGAQTAMLEFTRGDADDLFDDLINLNVSSWQKYGIATEDMGRYSTPAGNLLRVAHLGKPNLVVETLPETTALTAIFRAVDPGAVRIGTRSDQSWATAVAFRNPDNRLTVSIKADLGSTMKLLQKLHKRINTPLPQPGGGEWVKIRGVGVGHYAMQRSNTLVGRIMRCTVYVGADGKGARVYLREGDVATIAELPDGVKAPYPGCSHNPEFWQ